MDKASKSKSELNLDLKDPEVRRLLQDPNGARNAGLTTGFIAAAVGALSSILTLSIFSDFRSAVNKQEGNLGQRLVGAAKQNKLLTFLVAAPAFITFGAGIYGYFLGRNEFKKQQQELLKVEVKEQRVASEPSNLARADGKSWKDVVADSKEQSALRTR